MFKHKGEGGLSVSEVLVVSLCLGFKLQNLASLRVFGMESHLYLPIQVSLSTVHKESYKNCPD